jgi:hypothetical protein
MINNMSPAIIILTTIVICSAIYFLWYRRKQSEFEQADKNNTDEYNNNLSPSLNKLLKEKNIRVNDYNIINNIISSRNKPVELTEDNSTNLSDLELNTNEKEEITKELEQLP